MTPPRMCTHCHRAGHTANMCKSTHTAHGEFLGDYSDEDSEDAQDHNSVYLGSEGAIEHIEAPAFKLEECKICKFPRVIVKKGRCSKCLTALIILESGLKVNEDIYRQSKSRLLKEYNNMIKENKKSFSK